MIRVQLIAERLVVITVCLVAASGCNDGSGGTTPGVDAGSDAAIPRCADDDPCGSHGSCSDSGGELRCSCNTGYAGETCDECYPGYHWEGDVCVVDQLCQVTSCSGHGACSDAGGVVSCSCDAGYGGDHCEACDDGYHFEGSFCVADQTCEAGSCSGHGTCSEAGGVIACQCAQGYSGADCGDCAAGFQDNDNDDTCLPDCTLAAPPCVEGTCDDSGGTAECACDVGFSGPLCGDCDDDANEDDDMDSTGTFLSGDHSATGLILCPGDEDWYQIYLGETWSIDLTLQFSNAAGNIDLYLWYPWDSAPSDANKIAASESTTADGEAISYTVPVGAAGLYFIEIRGAGYFRSTYDLDVDVTVGAGCQTCPTIVNSLGDPVQCGTWDDHCGGTVTCGPCGAGEVCDEYFGICADDLCDFPMGCCDGNTLNTCAFGPQYSWDCSAWAQQCGWIVAGTFPGMPGHYACDAPANLTSPPAGVVTQCPAGFTFP